MRMAGVIALAALEASAASAQRRAPAPAGWVQSAPTTPEDNGSRTAVQLARTAAGAAVTWVGFAGGEGGSIAIEFAARGKCRDQWFGARLTFDDPSVTHEAAVRREVHDAFVKFRAKCGAPPATEAMLMTGFSAAFAAAEKRVAAGGTQ